MKKNAVLVIVCLSMTFSLLAQKKMYVWEPKVENYSPISILKNVHVNIEIQDLRVIAPGSEIKATFEQISNAILNSIKKAYGDTFINPKSDTTIIIEVKSYDATFYSGMWHAQTRYIVKFKNTEKDIEQTNNTFNALGKSSAKSLLSKCFTGANMKLFDVLNGILKK